MKTFLEGLAGRIRFLRYDGNDWRKAIKEILIINAGILLVAIGTVFFKTPNRFALGGVSGISVILLNFFPNYPIGFTMMLMNILLLAAGYILLGKGAASKSLYGSFALSGMIWLLEILFPINAPLTSQKLLELIYGVFIPGVGSALVFHYGATTGGTDIVAKILTKHFNMRTSIALLCSDFLIAFTAGFIFGPEAGLFSVFGVCLKSFALDAVLESLHIYKIVVVVSKENRTIIDYICNTLKRDATVHKGWGAYTNDEKVVITTILDRQQAAKLQAFIRSVDPNAFTTISDSTRIVGKGFERFE